MRSIHLYIIIILSFGALLFTSCKSKEEPKLLGSVYGTVIDKNTSNPIQNAGVELMTNGKMLQKTITGSDGLFEFPKVEAGIYNLCITKSGYLEYQTTDILVNEDSKDKPVHILLEKLPPALTILDGDGNKIDTIEFGDLKNDIIRSFNIFNDCENMLDWQITWAESWIELNKDRGQLKANGFQTIVIKIDRSKLISGINNATLIITSDNGNKELFVLATGEAFIETNDATNISTTSAILNGKISRKPPTAILQYGFVYNQTPTPSLENGAFIAKVESEPAIAPFSYMVEDLVIDKNYFYRAYATTSDGTFYGEERSFRAEASLPLVETTKPRAETLSQAIGGGNVTSDGGFKVGKRGVCWSSNNAAPTIELDTHTIDGDGTGSFISHIEPLQKGKKYYVRAYAQNIQGINYGKTETLEMPTGEPTILTTVPIVKANTITIGGNITSDGGLSIKERGICYSKTNTEPTLSDCFEAQGTGMGQYSVTISGLTENTVYYMRAYAKNSNGTYMGNVITAKTLYGDVTVLTSDVTNITANSAVSGVSVIDLGGATLQSCGICWGTSSTPTLNNNAFVEASRVKGTYSCNITNLIPETRYYVRAYATTENGAKYGDVKKFTTLNCMPSVTTTQPSAAATTVLSGGIIIANGGYTITACGVCYSKTNSSPTITDGCINANNTNANTFSVTIPNLTPNTQYYVRAYVTNSCNSTAYGSAYSIITKNGNITIATHKNFTNITSESATGGYQITETGGANIKSAGICWSTSRYPTISDNKTSGGTTIGTYSCNINGLASNTTYYVRAYAESDLGTTYGTSYSFTTLAKSDYVDLGLPSGTKWRDHNESSQHQYNFYFNGGKVPTKVQWEELKNLCTWRWTGNGYMVTGLNGNYIILSAEGHEYNVTNVYSGGTAYGVGTWGYYWTSDDDPNNYTMGIGKSDYAAWAFVFNQSNIYFALHKYTNLLSVRLVQ